MTALCTDSNDAEIENAVRLTKKDSKAFSRPAFLVRASSLFLLSALMCAACTPVSSTRPSASAESNKPTSSSEKSSQGTISGTAVWRIDLQVSGGFAGENYELHLDRAGAWLDDDHRRRRQETRVLHQQELAPIEQLIAGAMVSEMGSEDSAVSEQCRDCFVYIVRIKRGDKERKFHLDSVTVHGRPVESLIQKMLSLRANK